MKLVRGMILATALVSACACSVSKTGPEQASGGTRAQAAAVARITDPCKLLTQAEASELIGARLEPGELKRLGIITRCAFYNKRAQQLGVFLDVHNDTAPEPDAVLFDSYTHMPNANAVSGIGDQALWSHSEIGSGLHIMKGGRLVQMGLPRTVATMTPAVEKAARLIASRM